MTTLTHRIDRDLLIKAAPAIVFSFFTETPRWAAWWGAGSEIDPRPGGRMKICYPGGREATGEVIEVTPPTRIVFTYGYVDGQMIPPGGSRVTIDLQPVGAATRLRLTHDVANEQVRDSHVQGWRYQLSLFANIVADQRQRRSRRTRRCVVRGVGGSGCRVARTHAVANRRSGGELP